MNFAHLNKAQKASIVVFGIFVLLVAVWAISTVVNKNYVPLYQSKDLSSVALVTDELVNQGVNFELDKLGQQVLVSPEEVDLLKVKLATVTELNANSPGFELFDNLDYSMTEKAQNITYLRAIQGELEQTLINYAEIESARVHLVIPDKRLFSKDQQVVKAAVSIWIDGNKAFPQERVSGIQKLVASSIEGLSENNVTVLDGLGRQMSRQQQTNVSMATSEVSSKLEHDLTEKARKILGLYFNDSQFAISVSATIDNKKQTSRTHSILVANNEEGAIVRKKEQVTEDESSELGNKENKLEVEYEHGSKVDETIFLPGQVSKLSVAIAIRAADDSNIAAKLENLLKAGLGVKTERGDNFSLEIIPVTEAKQLLPVQPTNTVVLKEETDRSQVSHNGNELQTINEESYVEYSKTIWFLVLLAISILLLSWLFVHKQQKSKPVETLKLEFKQWIDAEREITNAR